jgi:ribosome-associated protein
MSDVVIKPGITIPAGELSVAFSRSGGPGGQNVNKVASKAVVRFDLRATTAIVGDDKERALARLASRLTQSGELIVTASATRDQGRNRAAALARLATLLAAAVTRPRRRRPSKPSMAAVARRLDAKTRRARTKRERRTPSDD